MAGRALRVEISIARQELVLLDGGTPARRWPVSTARNGAGERKGSGCTPRGRHRIRLRIGAGCPLHTVFVARRPTGEIWTPALERRYPERDWILTRILWLSGTEPGFNRGGDRDTLRRYIYIHGTADEARIGQPVSHGCIRMKNRDVQELFDLVTNGTPVHVEE
jgi:lipoprotein-anchoring transpeptidase ErfK/SrfK